MISRIILIMLCILVFSGASFSQDTLKIKINSPNNIYNIQKPSQQDNRFKIIRSPDSFQIITFPKSNDSLGFEIEWTNVGYSEDLKKAKLHSYFKTEDNKIIDTVKNRINICFNSHSVPVRYTCIEHRQISKLIVASVIPGSRIFFSERKKWLCYFEFFLEAGALWYGIEMQNRANNHYDNAVSASNALNQKRLDEEWDKYKSNRKNAKWGLGIFSALAVFNWIDAMINAKYIECRTNGDALQVVYNFNF